MLHHATVHMIQVGYRQPKRLGSPRLIWVCLKIEKTPKPNGFADHKIPIKWLFHWEYTLFSDKPICFSLKS